MDHQISTRTQATERYLLGELEPLEREEFEEHFFDCAECAENVRTGFLFAESAKAVFREEACRAVEPLYPAKRRKWLIFMRLPRLAVIAAGLSIVAFSSYQNVMQIPALYTRLSQLQRPQVVASVELKPASRSPVPSIVIPKGAQFFQFSMPVNVVAPAEKYQCDLHSESGRFTATIPVSGLVADSQLTLLIPTDSVSTGYYEVVLEGLTNGVVTKLDHFRFSVRRE